MSSTFTWSTYVIVFGALGILVLRDRAKAKQALKIAVKSFFGMLPILLAFIGLIGLLLGLVSPETIARYLGQGAGWSATLTALFLGAALYIASLVSIPLAASLLRKNTRCPRCISTLLEEVSESEDVVFRLYDAPEPRIYMRRASLLVRPYVGV